MQLTGKLTDREVKEVRRIVWVPHYHLSLFNNYTQPRFFQLMGIVLVGSILTIWIDQKTGISPTLVGGIIGALSVGSLVYLLTRWHRLPLTALNKINAGCPESIEIDDEGVTLRQADGVSTSMPWSVMTCWRTGILTVVIDFAQNANMLPVPLQQLSAEDQDSMRHILQQHLGNPTFVLQKTVGE